ncbi:MAG: CinA family protein, partial [Anaerolineae bacterium]|nr:CinA family protein [Anaerolineae bacterium]
NEVKQELLAVPETSLIRWGAVSTQVAQEMAEGACAATGAEAALSITGIAGPTGATPTKPVGLYYIALAVPGECWCWRHRFNGTREENNHRAAEAAIRHLLAYLSSTSHYGGKSPRRQKPPLGPIDRAGVREGAVGL